MTRPIAALKGQLVKRRGRPGLALASSHNPHMATALSLTHLGSLMRGVRSVDQVGADERAASLAKRSIKQSSKLWALDLAVRCMDLTTLEGADTPGKVAAMFAKAVRPKPGDATVPSVAAVCVYPLRIADCVQALRGSQVRIASVATAFPSGQSFTSIKVAETEQAVQAGAHEIDMVIDRGAFLSGDYQRVYDEIVAVKEACGAAHLKVILETGELGNYDAVRRASILAMAAGADFIKTSTGKVQPAATLPVALVMMEAIRDFVRETGRPVGFKAAGGIRTSKQAIAYLVITYETLGVEWLTPERLRLGASTLLNDVLMQIDKERSGAYQSADYFTVDGWRSPRSNPRSWPARHSNTPPPRRRSTTSRSNRATGCSSAAAWSRHTARNTFQRSTRPRRKRCLRSWTPMRLTSTAPSRRRARHSIHGRAYRPLDDHAISSGSRACSRSARASWRWSRRWTAASRSRSLEMSTSRSARRTSSITRAGPTSSSGLFRIASQVRSGSPARSSRGTSPC